MKHTETLSPVLPNETEEATRRLLARASERGILFATAESCTGGGCARSGRAIAHREEHFGDRGRGATRIACMKVAVEMMTEMM